MIVIVICNPNFIKCSNVILFDGIIFHMQYAWVYCRYFVNRYFYKSGENFHFLRLLGSDEVLRSQ